MGKNEDLLVRDDVLISDVMKLRFYPITAKYTRGIEVVDEDGKEYLDFSAGWGVANIGYGHPDIGKVVMEQLEKNSFSGTISVVNEESVLLAEQLIELMPGDFSKKVWYGHSGSDANEFIAKMVGQAESRNKLITFVGSYHGQTMGSYAMSGHPAQGRFAGTGNVTMAPYPNCYRCAFGKRAESCNLFCAEYVDKYILGEACDPSRIGALVVEAIQCDGGDIVPPPGFLKKLEMACKKKDILFILDEVKIGFGRTGHMFGFSAEGIVPDAVVLAKPMASGFPLSAVVGRRELMDAGLGQHLFTTAGNPLSCRVALETLKIIENENLVENARQLGEYFMGCLRGLRDKYEQIGHVRGRGLVIGAELIEGNGSEKEATELAAMVTYRAYERGLLFFCAGIHSNVLEFTPPLIITKEEIDRGVAILDRAISDVLEGKVDVGKVRKYAGWSS